jgi:hypothetical protein
VPACEFADQLRLVEAVALSVDREIWKAIQGQSRFGALASLPLDRVDRPAAACAAAMPAVVNSFTVTERPYGSTIWYGADR